LEGYLYAVVRNCIKDKQKRSLELSTSFGPTEDGILYDQVDDQAEDPEQIFLDKERRQELIELLRNGIPNQYHRDVILARYFVGYSLQEIADYYQVSESTIKSILHRSLHKLRILVRNTTEKREEGN
jgi:RNA polymerase sigma factor (sigma-70 family)